MNRQQFLHMMAWMPLIGNVFKSSALQGLSEFLPNTTRMPVLFLGHGSPMNAIEENEFVQGFRIISKNIPTPTAILCISAHWETNGTFVTAMDHPKTIYDFGGFPKELYEVQYPAPGSPALAKETQSIITKTTIGLDQQWGLDHGAWTVLKHLYPKANIPIIQFSLDYNKPPLYHYELAKELSALRNKGILIVGSGNNVHNLRMVDWNRMNEQFAFDWAKEADQLMQSYILNMNHTPLIQYESQGTAFRLAIPTPEHYLPMLYVLALQQKEEVVQFFNNKPIAGSLSMTSFQIG